MTKKLLLHLSALVLFSFPAYSFQEDPAIDSMRLLVDKGDASLTTYGELARMLFQYDIDEGHGYLIQMDSLAVIKKDTLNIISANNFKAEYYWRKGDYESAAIPALRALNVAESWGKDPNKVARAYQTLGTIHLYLINSEKALEYYKLALDVFRELNQPVDISKILNNTGVVYMDMTLERGIDWGYDSAIVYYEKVLEFKDQANTSTIINSLSNLIQIYNERGMLKEGMALLRDWNPLIENESGNGAKVMNYGSIASLYVLNGERDKALKYYNEGLELALEMGMNYDALAYYDHLSRFHEKLNQPEKALGFLKKRDILKDTIYEHEKAKAVNELEIQYESEKKNNEITLLRQEAELKDLQVSRANTERNFFVVVTLLTVIIIVLFVYMYWQKSKRNKVLNQLNDTKNKLFKLISHDLKSPVSSFYSLTSSLSQNMEYFSQEKIRQYLQNLQEASRQLNNLLLNLLNWAISESDGLPYQPERFNILDTAGEVLEVFKVKADMKNIAVENNISQDIFCNGDKKMFSTIMHNLVDNALKFTPEGGKVSLSTELQGKKALVTVSDSGIGIDKKGRDMLFDLNQDVRNIGNSTEKGTGLGLILCKELAGRNGGEIWVEGEEGKGSRFTFTMERAV